MTTCLSEHTETEKSDAINAVFGPVGGSGKTLISALVAEYLKSRGRNTLVFDADPAKKTLAQIKALDVTPVDILFKNDAGEIVLDTPKMDEVFSRMLETDDSVVFDCGGAGYERVTSYLLANEMIETLAESRRVVVHCVVVGGRDHPHTVEALAKFIKMFPSNVEKVMWINNHFGPLEFNGQSFMSSAFVVKNINNLAATILMPQVSPVYTAGYFNKMVKENLTFGEVLDPANKEWNPLAKVRMRKLWNDVEKQLAEIL